MPSLVLKQPPDSLALMVRGSVRQQLRIIGTPADVTYIDELTEAAARLLDGPQSKTGRALITQQWTLGCDEFPARIALGISPVQSVTFVKYRDAAGSLLTLAADKYRLVDAASWDPAIVPAFGEAWPETRADSNTVEVEFIAGYGDDHTEVPAPILQAIRQLVAHWYDQREAVSFSTPHELPLGVRELIQPFRIYR